MTELQEGMSLQTEITKTPQGAILELHTSKGNAAARVSKFGAGVLDFTTNGDPILHGGRTRGLTAKGDTSGQAFPASFFAAPFGRPYEKSPDEFVEMFPAFKRIEETRTDGKKVVVQSGISHGPTNTSYPHKEEIAGDTYTLSARTDTKYMQELFAGRVYAFLRNFHLIQSSSPSESHRLQITSRVTYEGNVPGSEGKEGVVFPIAEHMQINISEDQDCRPCVLSLIFDANGDATGYKVLDIKANIKQDKKRGDERLDGVLPIDALQTGNGYVLIMPEGLESGRVVVVKHTVNTNIPDLPEDYVIFSRKGSGFVSVERRLGSYKPLLPMQPGEYLEQSAQVYETTLENFAASQGMTLPSFSQVEYIQI